MKGFQLKLAIVLMVAIIAVVAVATTITVLLIRPPDPRKAIVPIAQAVELAVSVDQAGDQIPTFERSGIAIVDTPPQGQQSNWPTEYLRSELAGSNVFIDRVIIDPATGDTKLVVALANSRWLVMDVPDIPELGRALSLISGWAFMIVLGAISIALVAVRRITAPVMQIEAAIASVGSEGILPHVEPRGSPSERETAMMLNRLGDRLKTALASRMRLVAAAGHDLRTPLTRMLLRVEFLPEDEREAWRSDLEELGQIADSAIRLVREEAGGDEARSVVDIGEIVSEIGEELTELGLPITVESVRSERILASRTAIKRALRNLMTNAASHGQGGHVTLQRYENGIAVTIDDNGPGIPDYLLDQAFEPFFRVDSARRKPIAGAGLGLAIAKEIIERFGGTISLANRTSQGLRQTVWLPSA